MHSDYQLIIHYMLSCGKRIKDKAGKIEDIGVLKKYLTDEDLQIERGFVDIIKNFAGDHVVFAEEENDKFEQRDNIWIMDPISGTKTFINGLPHYAIVCSHLHKGEVVFACVYDPSVEEIYVAEKGKGASLNGRSINVSEKEDSMVLFNLSEKWEGTAEGKKYFSALFDNKVFRNTNSFAINYAWVAAGKFSGIFAMTKDTFPEYAGQLLIEEAGGIFTNDRGEINIKPDDRIFIGGSKDIHRKLIAIIK